ncbi:Rho GTPase-activating protein 19 [Halocaridina rubra]|uniref:Rho GTPase-activating protein 19 n=1 Tax=Halocaridina rubra TaxID=373956 RepID=A0AAN8WJ93_HALRR
MSDLAIVYTICGHVELQDTAMNTSQQSQELWEGNIQKQLWHLRYEDPTQYQALVKMHLSFTTDLPVDECDGRAFKQSSSRKWQLTSLIRLLGRSAVYGKGVMEGAPLTQEGVCQAFQLIHFLNKEYNITQEGLFRKSGSLSRQQELKNQLNSGGVLNLDSGSHSAHDCASVLKSFLADLPEPLLTEGHYFIHCKIAEMMQSHMCKEQKEVVHTRQIKALRLLFLLLPPENYQLLQDLLILLNRVAANKKHNLMSAQNLGTMFAPHILCPRKMTANDLQYLSGTLSSAVAFMIENASDLFQIPVELEYDVRHYWNNRRKLKHQLSKRSMMDAPTNTIFTFIDRELTAQANDKDVTEVALAELYAYVQSLPDSAKKRRLIKKFNHASGCGTPQLNQSISRKPEPQGKRLGDSIKKHLFHKTVKVSKSISQPIVSSVSLGVKRINSEDLLSSPSSKSPELRRFHHNMECDGRNPLNTKPLEDLMHLKTELATPSASSSEQLTCTSIMHPAFNEQSNFICGRKLSSVTMLHKDNSSRCSSVPDSESGGSLASPLPLAPNFLTNSIKTKESIGISDAFDLEQPSLTSTGKEDLPCFDIPSTTVEEDTKENTNPLDAVLQAATIGPSANIHSPISEAMLRSSIPKNVIMTPRSRCPIIVNSVTNLANTALIEEVESFVCNKKDIDLIHDEASQTGESTIIRNPSATQLISPEKYESPIFTSDLNEVNQDDDIKSDEETDGMGNVNKGSMLGRWKSSSLRRTLSSASSTGSLFGNFFHQLSTSSLGQLATRLTSATSLVSSLSEEENEDSEDSLLESSICKEQKAVNESLSSIFREYLLSRSILTDNPVDLSVHCLDNESKREVRLEGLVDGTDHDSSMILERHETLLSKAVVHGTCDTLESIKSDKMRKDVYVDNVEQSNIKQEEYIRSLPQTPCLGMGHVSSTPSGASFDASVASSPNVTFSDSLLFCLDGNNPLSTSALEDSVNTEAESESSPCLQPLVNKAKLCTGSDLHACTPESRMNSILQTKQGTPIPLRDRENTQSLTSTKGIIFETSF